MSIRSPICTVAGHVDHGKTSVLDKIRGTAIVETEAGRITQAIGASIVPLTTIRKICGPLLERLNIKFTIPGLLFIDTPGHAAFTNLRKRGGNLADIAIVVIDINEGIKPQTTEVIDILKQYKTPFVVALNKIDLISGWQSNKTLLLENVSKQSTTIQQLLDKKLYELVGRLSTFGLNSERFDRVDDYTKQIAIIPLSAKTGEGIPELLMVITGLAQKYLEKKLDIDIKRFAKGTILEVKETKGLGITLDVIVYDGTLKRNDLIVIGGLEKPIVTKVKALFEPMPLAEMRDKKTKFKAVQSVSASTGIKISSPDIENVVAGMPLRACKEEELEKVKEEIQKEVEEVVIETDDKGIIIKADTLGSLEALIKLLKEKNITIRKASVGNISKKDIAEASTIYAEDPLKAVVLGFNVSCDMKEVGLVKIITSDIIYKIIEEFEKWQTEEKARKEKDQLSQLVMPCKLQILKGYVFRQSNPAVSGIEVLAGKLKVGVGLMKDEGKRITFVKSMQSEQENIEEAEKGRQLAISMDNVTIGRQVNEGDMLYSVMPESDFRKLKKLKEHLKPEEIEAIKEIAAIMRKENPTWGI